MPTGTRQDNLELLEDGAEIPKSQGRGWLSNSSSPLYLKKEYLPGGELPPLLWRSPVHPPSQKIKGKKKRVPYLHGRFNIK